MRSSHIRNHSSTYSLLRFLAHGTKLSTRVSRRLRLAAAIASSLSMLVASDALAQTTWTGAADNNWFNSSNWNPGVTPNGVSSDVIILGPVPTFINGQVNINSLSVDATGQVSVISGFNLNFGGTAATTLNNAGSMTILNNTDMQLARGVINSGSINVVGGGNLTDLEVIGDGATLSGGGTISLSGSGARIMGLTGAMLNIDSQTIQGHGEVGANAVGINNGVNGVIVANSNGNILSLDPSAAGNMVNQGVLRASDGGILQLSGIGGGNFNNNGGLIEALEGSTVRLSSASVNGGTLASTGTGVFTNDASANSFLENVTLAGNLQSLNNSDLGITGTINNSGSISVLNSGNLTDLEVQSGGATLIGGGTIALGGTTNNSRIDGVGGGVLTIADQTIEGHGQVGANLIGIVNDGNVINANVDGRTLTIDPNAATGMVNTGTLRASNGGVLQITGSGGGNFQNAGGTIEALEGSNVRLSSATVIGGTIATTGSGIITNDASSNTLLQDITLNGNLQSLNNSDLAILGSINNTGSINVINAGNLTDIEVQAGGASLTGGGTVTLGGSNNSSRIDGVGGGTLTIANQTIEGHGQLGANLIGIVNDAGNVINANVDGQTLTIDPNAATGMANTGTLRASNGGVLQLSGSGGGSFQNVGGLVEALDDSSVRLSSAVVVGGTLATTGSGMITNDANGSTLLQDVTLAGNLQSLNNSDLDLAGTITNSGSINVINAGNLTDIDVQAGGASLTGGGTVTLSGTTNTSRISGVSGSTLTIADQTIEGHGQLGTNLIGIVNGTGGVIHANSTSGPLTIDPNAAGGFLNDGTLRASNGGELVLSGTGAGSFSGGGTYEALDGGLIRSDSLAVVQSLNSNTLVEGSWRAIDDGNGAAIQLERSTLTAPSIIGADASVELSGANSAFTFGATSTPIDASLNTIQGSLTLQNGRNMTLNSQLTNVGDLFLVDAATTLTVSDNFSQYGGLTQLSEGATLELQGANNLFAGGMLAGNGFVDGSFTLDTGAILSPGLSPGQIDVTGDLFWNDGGLIQFDLGIDALESDFIDVYGELWKNGPGTFDFNFIDNGWVAGDTYDLIEFGSTNFLLEDFSYINSNGFTGSFAFSGGGGNRLQFTVSTVPEPGSVSVILVAGAIALMHRRRSRKVV